MLDYNQVYLGDCLEVMKSIDDKSIDMILTDLPYQVLSCKWDIIIPFDLLWEQYKRIIKNRGAIVLFGSEPFSSQLRLSNSEWYRYDIVWNKKKPSNFQMMNFQPGRIHEYIHVFSDSAAVYCNNKHMNYYPIKEDIEPYLRKVSTNGKNHGTLRSGHTIKDLGPMVRSEKNKYYSIVEFSNANIKGKLHPTEKPISLLEYLIHTYSKENDLILDSCAGSCSTAIAAMNTNRNFICIEKEEKYFEIGQKRIAENRNLYSILKSC